MAEQFQCLIEIRNRGVRSQLSASESDFILGRSSKLPHSIDSQEISREHLRIEIIGTKIWVTDLASTNGTYYKGKRLEPRVSVPYEGGELCMGPVAEGVYCSFQVPGLIEFAKEQSEPSVLRRVSARDVINPAPQNDPSPVSPPPPSERTLMDISRFTPKPSVVPATHGATARVREAVPEAPVQPVLVRSVPSHQEAVPSASISLAPSPSEAVVALRQSMHEGIDNDLQSKRQEIQKIQTEYQLVESRLRELQFEKTKIEALVRKIAEKEAEEQKVQERLRAVLEREAKSEENYRLIEQKRQQQESIIAQIHSEIEGWKQKAVEVQNQYHQEEKRVADLLMFLRSQEGDYQRKLGEVQLASENLTKEYEALKKRLRIEAESIEAEGQLKRAHIERDVEEQRTRKISLDREVQDLQIANSQLTPVVTQLREEDGKLKLEVSELRSQKQDLERDLESFISQKRLLVEEIATAEIQAKDIKLQNSTDIANTEKFIKQERANLEMELQTLRQKVTQEVELLKLQTDREMHEKLQTLQLDTTRAKTALEQELLEKRKNSITEMENMRTQLEQEVAQRRSGLQDEVDKVRAETDRECKQMRDKAEFDATERKAQILSGIEELKIRTEAEVEQLRKDAADAVARQKSLIDSEIAEQRTKLMAEIESTRTRSDQELRDREQKLLSDIAEEKAEAVAQIDANRESWVKEHESLMAKTTRDCEEISNRWKAEFEQLKQREMATLNQWKADENKKVQERLSSDIHSLAHEIATKTLSAYQQSGATTVYVQELMMSLQERLQAAILHGVPETAGFHPNSKNSRRKFWLQTGAFVASVVVGITAFRVLPDMIKNHVNSERNTRSSLTEEFLNRVKKANAEKLALNLTKRDVFQESYTDNVLYNEGYSQMKLDDSIHNDWIAKLNTFILKTLKLDDRVIVQFIPLENGLIKELEEQRKILNARNFDVVVAQMKTAEEEKTSQMWLTLGGRENWVQIRDFEKEYYEGKIKEIQGQ